jgi:hypothetical protein
MELIPAWDDLPDLSWKDKVSYLTHLSLQTPQITAPVSHIFEGGNYVREMRLPQGALLTGREHLLGHEMQLLEGSVILAAPDGKFEFHAFASMHTKPGFHAVVYALTNVLARSVHANPENCRNIDALEEKWFGRAEDVIARGNQIHQLIQQQGIEAWPQQSQ